MELHKVHNRQKSLTILSVIKKWNNTNRGPSKSRNYGRILHNHNWNRKKYRRNQNARIAHIERCVIESNDDHINCDFTTEELQTQIRDLKL